MPTFLHVHVWKRRLHSRWSRNYPACGASNTIKQPKIYSIVSTTLWAYRSRKCVFPARYLHVSHFASHPWTRAKTLLNFLFIQRKIIKWKWCWLRVDIPKARNPRLGSSIVDGNSVCGGGVLTRYKFAYRMSINILTNRSSGCMQQRE